jgi:hypothetical protein
VAAGLDWTDKEHQRLPDWRTAFVEWVASLFDEGVGECLSQILPLDKRFHTCERFLRSNPQIRSVEIASSAQNASSQ